MSPCAPYRGPDEQLFDEILRERIVIIKPDADDPRVVGGQPLGELCDDRAALLTDALVGPDGDAPESVQRGETVEPIPPGFRHQGGVEHNMEEAAIRLAGQRRKGDGLEEVEAAPEAFVIEEDPAFVADSCRRAPLPERPTHRLGEKLAPAMIPLRRVREAAIRDHGKPREDDGPRHFGPGFHGMSMLHCLLPRP